MKPHTYINKAEIDSIEIYPPRKRYDVYRKKSFWTGEYTWMRRGILGGEYPLGKTIFLFYEEPHIPYRMKVTMRNGKTHEFFYYTEEEIKMESRLLKNETFYSPI